MHSSTRLNAKLLHGADDGDGTAHCSGRTIECREETIAGGVGFFPAKPHQFFSHNRVVGIQEIAPCSIAKSHCPFG